MFEIGNQHWSFFSTAFSNFKRAFVLISMLKMKPKVDTKYKCTECERCLLKKCFSKTQQRKKKADNKKCGECVFSLNDEHSWDRLFITEFSGDNNGKLDEICYNIMNNEWTLY